MIRINLLGEQVDHSASYALQLILAAACVLGTIGACFIVHQESTNRLESQRAEKELLDRKLAKLEKITKQVEDLEKKRRTLREKLMTIATLKAKKHGPVHILDDINNALPERSWLLSMKEKSGALEINGVALDNQTIATFMKSLEGGKYFGSVDLVLSTEYVQDDVKLKQFTLSVGLKSLIKAPQPAPEADETGAKKKGRSGEV